MNNINFVGGIKGLQNLFTSFAFSISVTVYKNNPSASPLLICTG